MGNLFGWRVLLFQQWERATGQERMGEREIQRAKFVSATAGKFHRQTILGESFLFVLPRQINYSPLARSTVVYGEESAIIFSFILHRRDVLRSD